MIVYSEFRYHSALHDTEVIRLSVPDEYGAEYFTLIVDPPKQREYRKLRDDWIEVVSEILAEPKLGKRFPPGEVPLPCRSLSTHIR